jgi:hypothetical protein
MVTWFGHLLTNLEPLELDQGTIWNCHQHISAVGIGFKPNIEPLEMDQGQSTIVISILVLWALVLKPILNP